MSSLDNRGNWKVFLKRWLRSLIGFKRFLRNFKNIFPDGKLEFFSAATPYYLRYLPVTPSYVVEKAKTDSPRCPNGFSIPPQSYWLGYGQTSAEYLDSGHSDAAIFKRLFQDATDHVDYGPLLDLGCGSGRILRWLDHEANGEIWGVDINAELIGWNQQNLSPPMHFAVVTTAPHLPFPDEYFNTISAYSVFTHIDEMAFTWFQELRRILTVGGIIYITIHDEATIDAFREEDRTFVREIKSNPQYKKFIKTDFEMFTIYRGRDSQVFYRRDYLVRALCPWFKLLKAAPMQHGYQTILIFEKIG